MYQKAFILFGTVGDPSRHTVDDGFITVSSNTNHFPPVSWPVHSSHWKAVVYLEPGVNELKFTTWAPKLANSSSSNPIHAAYLNINMIPPHCAPPLQLAIVLAADSPERFDSVPARVQKDGNDLCTATRKYRTAAYLWQAFVTEQMRRHGMGPRSFTFEEEWVRSTSHIQDRENGTMRSEARIHVIRTSKSTAELLRLGQKDLLDDVVRAVLDYFKPMPGEKHHVSALLLDSRWEQTTTTVSGHVAHGGAFGDLNLAVFGSHCLQSYPNGLDEVWQSLEDCTQTDVNHVANGYGVAGSSWEAATFGMAGHLREVLRMFGCSDQVSGIMSEDALSFNRSFTTLEPFSTRTKSRAGFVAEKDECTLHRLDALRLRFHPCFRIPTNGLFKFDDSIQAYPVEVGRLVLQARSGVTHIEIWAEDDTHCNAWIGTGTERGLRNHYTLTEQDARERLPEHKRKGRIRLRVFSGGGGCLEIDDFRLLTSKASSLKLKSGPLAQMAYKGKPVGHLDQRLAPAAEVVFLSSATPARVLLRITAHFDQVGLYGIDFAYDDGSTQTLGSGGCSGAAEETFDLDVRRGEYLTGFYVRASTIINGMGFMTSLGKCSPVYGNPFGGTINNMVPPQGFTLCGVTTSGNSHLESFGIIITK